MNLNNLKNTGAYIKESLPNIRGGHGMYVRENNQPEGCVYDKERSVGWIGGNHKYPHAWSYWGIDASRYNNVYQEQAKVYPLSFVVYYCIKY